RSISRLSPLSLVLPISLSLILRPALSNAGVANVTVDDTSELILYTPSSSWHTSTDSCSTCLHPTLDEAFGGTWHQGFHTSDGRGRGGPDRTQRRDGNNKGHVSADERTRRDFTMAGDSSKNEGHGGWHLRSVRSIFSASQDPSDPPGGERFSTSNLEKDKSEPVDDDVVSAQFSFTGSAVYVYAIVPEGVAAGNSAPTAMNLTFLLDSRFIGSYQHTGTASASGFASSQLVLSQGDLTVRPHSLTIQLGPSSVLLLDYIIYTDGDNSGGGNNSTEPNTSAPAPRPKSNNVATFAGAVGGSVGLLAVLALSLAISIYRRRVRAARRDRHLRQAQNVDFDGESFHTDASEDSPPMQGPAPFIPRYFPGTVVPAPPPPYSPPSEQTAALLAGVSPISSPMWAPPRLPGPGEDTSYADRPPLTPPPLADDGFEDYFAAPSFPQSISSPIPAMLAGYAPVSTTSAPVSASPVPRHANGPESRGVYATVAPVSRSRRNSDAYSQRSDWSDRPPSFASQAPPLIPLPPPESQHGTQSQGDGGPVDVVGRNQEQRTSDEDRNSVRSARSR
ncbi:hypothetical protein C2E23DRAFT_722881, partial [Lenzites betulinus]